MWAESTIQPTIGVTCTRISFKMLLKVLKNGLGKNKTYLTSTLFITFLFMYILRVLHLLTMSGFLGLGQCVQHTYDHTQRDRYRHTFFFQDPFTMTNGKKGPQGEAHKVKTPRLGRQDAGLAWLPHRTGNLWTLWGAAQTLPPQKWLACRARKYSSLVLSDKMPKEAPQNKFWWPSQDQFHLQSSLWGQINWIPAFLRTFGGGGGKESQQALPSTQNNYAGMLH